LDERETFIGGTLLGALAVGAGGGILMAVVGGWAWAVAFGLGSAISLVNFHLITRAVTRVMDDSGGVQPPARLWKAALLRFLFVGGVLCTAIVAFRVNALALLAGLVLSQLGMIGWWLVRSVRTPR
jgi:hypothetical protein